MLPTINNRPTIKSNRFDPDPSPRIAKQRNTNNECRSGVPCIVVSGYGTRAGGVLYIMVQMWEQCCPHHQSIYPSANNQLISSQCFHLL